MANTRCSDELAIASAQNSENEKYWLHQLSDELVKCSFPYDYFTKTKCDQTIDILNFKLPHQLFSRLMTLTDCSDLRMFITLTATLVVLLNKYTHQQDIIVGTSIYKQKEDVEFINTVLALRNSVKDNITFKELLMQVGKVIFEANKHRNYPIETLLHLLGMPFEEDEDFPLFDIAILLENLHDPRYLRHIYPNMTFNFNITGEKMELNVEYNSLRYMNSTINRITSHFINLLTKAVFNVNLRLADIDVLSENEKHEILFEFNDTKTGYSRDKTLHLLFEERVERTPDNIAVISMKDVLHDMAGVGHPYLRSRENHLTYGELNKKSNQWARELKKVGVKPNSFVGIVMDRSMEMLIGVKAILKAGGAYVPLEPYLPDARIITCLASLNVKFLLTNLLQLGKIEKISAQLPELKHIFLLDKAAKSGIEKNSEDNLISTAAATDIAYVIFTSGTTGVPKGVVEQHRPVINIIEWVNNTFQVDGWDKLLFVASLSFDLSVYDIFGILATGGSIRMVGSAEMKLPDRLLEVIFEEGITFWDSAPAALQQLMPFVMEHKENWQSKSSRLRLVFLSGDWIPVTMPDLLKVVFKSVNVIALGGATEATIWSNFYHTGAIDPNWKSIPYGKPISNAKYYIIDQQLHPCLIGVPGDLYIGGECLASGYINDIELTANKFVDNPFVAGETIYRTGDMARWYPDGNIEFLGRRDNQVKIRGFRIELGEIERRLLTHDEINETIVTALESENGDKCLCAYITCTRPLSVSELKEFLADRLPDYMIPAYFVSLERLPLSPNGKVDRKQLPPPALSLNTNEYEAPRNWLEKRMVEIWSEVLKIEKDSIGINTDFFESGGHSLNLALMTTKMHRELNINIPLADVFTTSTIKGLFQKIMGMTKEENVSIKPVEKKEYYPLTSAQKRIFLSQQLQLTSTSYNIHHLQGLGEDIDRKKLEETFGKLVARHEALRTSFELVEEETVQRISDHLDFAVEYYEEGNITQYLKTGEVEEIIKNFVRPFDLAEAPLLRVGLIKTMSRQNILLFDMHHIITDASSLDILIEDFTALYSGIEPEPLVVQYKDFSEWQNSPLRKGQIKHQEKYWLDLFSDANELLPLDLPMDFERSLDRNLEGDIVEFRLEDEEARFFRKSAADIGGTLFMSLLAVLNILLSKLSGREDIVIGTPIEGRSHADLERVVGLFINTLPIRNFPAKDKSFNDFLLEIKQRVLDTLANQDYQFEDLLNKIEIKRDVSRIPLIDVVINFRDRSNRAVTHRVTKTGESSQKDTYEYKQNTSNFDIVFTAVDFGDYLYIYLIYRSKLFKKETIHRFFDYFREIIATLREDGNITLGDVSISHDLAESRIDTNDEDYVSFDF